MLPFYCSIENRGYLANDLRDSWPITRIWRNVETETVIDKEKGIAFVPFDRHLLHIKPCLAYADCSRTAEIARRLFPDECFGDEFNRRLLPTLPIMPSSHLTRLDQAIDRIYRDKLPPTHELAAQSKMLLVLENLLGRAIPKLVRLVPFGSSKNGFGFGQSDVDLTILLKDSSDASESTIESVLAKTADVLGTCPNVSGIVPLPNARISIVKFDYEVDGIRFSCDLCCQNHLALRNTRLIHTYAQLDTRCRKLGYCLKGSLLNF